MRLWHKDLIPVLPRKQLLAQWRECCAIAGKIAKTGSPNHILVNKVLEHSQLHFIEYAERIIDEMKKRSYRVSGETYARFLDNIRLGRDYFYNGIMINKNIYPDWMNERYLTQCYYNLQEKYDCGGISDEEWKPIQEFYHNFIEKEMERRRTERKLNKKEVKE